MTLDLNGTSETAAYVWRTSDIACRCRSIKLSPRSFKLNNGCVPDIHVPWTTKYFVLEDFCTWRRTVWAWNWYHQSI